jgi:hypothetical protein
MRYILKKLIEKKYILFSFLIPFPVLGFTIGEYVFSAALFALIFIDILLILNGEFNAYSLAALFVFLFWCIIISVSRLEVDTYLFSFLALGTMFVPLVAIVPYSVRPKKIIRSLEYGLIVSFVLAAYEMGVNVGLTPLTEIFSGIGLWGTNEIQESVYFGVYRVKSGQTEPSHYAHYLVFSYAIVDQVDQKDIHVIKPYIIKCIIFTFLIATVSLSGLIMFVSYLGANVVLNWRKIIIKKLFTFKLWLGIPFLLLAGALVAGYYGQMITEYISWTFGRLNDAVAAVQYGLVQGSEASRARSAVIHLEYWASKNWWGAMIGEGYGNQSEWLISEFGHLKGTSFAEGKMHNNFAYIGVTTGIVGFVLYLKTIYTLVLKNKKIPTEIVVVWIVAHFAMGFITSYRFWWPLLVGVTIFKNKNR